MHSLVFKSSDIDWRKMRLAAQLKAAVETIDMLVLGFEQATSLVSSGAWPAVEDKLRLHDFFTERVRTGAIPSELAPKDWSRFVDNVYRLFMAFEGRNPSHAGSHKLAKLEDFLECVDAAINGYGVKTFPRSVSLFQFTLGELARGRGTNKPWTGYSLPISGAFSDLFGAIPVPAQPFECSSEDG
jgi:hypothetical protein